MDPLAALRQRKAELETALAAATGAQALATLGREHARLTHTLALADGMQQLSRTRDQLATDAAGADAELAQLAREELVGVERELATTQAALTEALTPRDPDDDRDALVEIRAGTGGDEAALFAQDLFRMYQRFAERRGWNTALLSAARSDLGGLKEVIFRVSGEGAFGTLRHEGGVHRVQRIPATEKSGRVHTSTATVAVLPHLEPVDLQIDAKDLRIDTSTSRGHGGQSVNTTYSAIRIVHLPTGLIVTCQDERSQIQNRERAMEILRARLWAQQEATRQAAEAHARRGQIGRAERSDKIRTYNVPQDRVTDHRIGLTVHAIADVFDGRLDELLAALRRQRTEELSAAPGSA